MAAVNLPALQLDSNSILEECSRGILFCLFVLIGDRDAESNDVALAFKNNI